MDWREFVASLAGSLAWPGAAVVVAVLFRSRLVALLSGPVKSLKAGPISVDFWQEEARIVRDDLVAAAAETTTSGAPWTIGHEDLGETGGYEPHDDHHVDAELAQLRELADKCVSGSFRPGRLRA